MIADNLSAHKTAQVKAFLEVHRNVHMHFTPTYSSWLTRSSCGSPGSSATASPAAYLNRNLVRYIRRYNKEPKPAKWKYFDPTRRISSASAVTVH